MQCIAYFLLLKFYPYKNAFNFLTSIHYSILIFNLLPIYPLDGGKIVNLFLSLFLSFRTSFNYTIIISYIILFILTLFLPTHFNINYLFMTFFLFYKITSENKKKNYYFDKFLLERYLYTYAFTKVKIVPSIKDFKRGYKHIVNNSKGVFDERVALNNTFEKNKF